MKTRKLKFANLQTLWRFRVEANLLNVDIDTGTSTLCCRCDDAQLSLARGKYKAILMSAKPRNRGKRSGFRLNWQLPVVTALVMTV